MNTMKTTSFLAFLVYIICSISTTFATSNTIIFGTTGIRKSNIIHTIHLQVIPKNKSLLTNITLKYGYMRKGECRYVSAINAGNVFVEDGTKIEFKNNELKNLIHGGYTCMSLVFAPLTNAYNKFSDNFRLFWNGTNYTITNPVSLKCIFMPKGSL